MPTRSTGRARCARTIGLTTGGPTGGSRREVPFCASATMAPIFVLARSSVLGGMHEIADFALGPVGRSHQGATHRSPSPAGRLEVRSPRSRLLLLQQAPSLSAT